MVLDEETALPGVVQPLSAYHVRALDGLRGIAILIVMCHHCEVLLPGSTQLGNFAKAVLRSGWTGVDLFFVLSGFLITGILIDTKGAVNYLQSFYARRALRIFPLYYAVLGSIVLLANLAYQPAIDTILAVRADQVYYFFYLNNWWILLHDTTWHANAIGHFWSLAVEEQFYVLWPLAVLLIPSRHLLKAAAGGCIAAFLLRAFLVWKFGASHAIEQNTFTRMDTLLAGAFCAVIVRDWNLSARWKNRLIPIGLVAAAAFWAQRDAASAEVVGYSTLALAYSALVLKIYLDRDVPDFGHRFLEQKWLRNVGKYSYGMYVFHVPLLLAVSGTVRTFAGYEPPIAIGLMAFFGVFLLTYFVALVSYEAFEKRFLAMRSRFEACPPSNR